MEFKVAAKLSIIIGYSACLFMYTIFFIDSYSFQYVYVSFIIAKVRDTCVLQLTLEL